MLKQRELKNRASLLYSPNPELLSGPRRRYSTPSTRWKEVEITEAGPQAELRRLCADAVISVLRTVSSLAALLGRMPNGKNASSARDSFLLAFFPSSLRAIWSLALFLGLTTPVLAQDPYVVVHGWPRLPEGYALGQVSGVAVDSHNHVFVFHRGVHPVLCLDGVSGEILGAWGDGMFGTPHGLKVDRQDNVWVTDIGHHQVFKFSHDGELLLTLGARDVPGLDGKHFNKPTDIVIAPNGEFYITDGYGNSRVAKFSASGQFLFDWGTKGKGPGQFDTPHGIALDKQGRVYVCDRGNARVQVFTGDGKYLAEWKSDELGRPWGIAIGPDHHAYVVDGGDGNQNPPDHDHVVKLDLAGHVLAKWASFGSYDGQLYWGHDIAVGRDGAVYVGDVYVGMRVQKFVLK